MPTMVAQSRDYSATGPLAATKAGRARRLRTALDQFGTKSLSDSYAAGDRIAELSDRRAPVQYIKPRADLFITNGPNANGSFCRMAKCQSQRCLSRPISARSPAGDRYGGKTKRAARAHRGIDGCA